MSVKSTTTSSNSSGVGAYGGSMFPPARRAAEMSDREYAFRNAERSPLWTPSAKMAPSTERTHPDLDSAEAVCNAPTRTPTKPKFNRGEVQAWVNSTGADRKWTTLEGIYRSSASITHLVEALWAQKYGPLVPIPDSVIMPMRIRYMDSQQVVGHLSITDASAESRASIPKYNGTIDLQRVDGFFQPIHNVEGHGVRGPILAWIGANSGQAVNHAGLRRFVTRDLGVRGGVMPADRSLPWKKFGDMIETYASKLVFTLNGFQYAVNEDVELLPEDVALTALRVDGVARTPQLLTLDKADKLPQKYSQLRLHRVGPIRYWIANISGVHTFSLALRWARGMGYKVVDRLERLMVASVWMKREPNIISKMLFQSILDYVRGHGKKLGERLEWMREVTQGPDLVAEDLDELEVDADANGNKKVVFPKRRFVIRVGRIKGVRGKNEVIYLDRLVFRSLGPNEDLKKLAKYGDVYWQYEGGVLKLEKIGGTGSFDVAEAWLQGVGLVYQDVKMDRSIVAGILQFVSSEVRETITWGDVKARVAKGLPEVLAQLRHIHTIITGESHSKLVWVMRLTGKAEDAPVGQMAVLTPEEVKERHGDDGNILKITFEQANGRERVVDVRGKGSPEFKALLKTGGVTFAPDASEMDKAAQRFANQPEVFGSTENICKPEPLFTPAELMKTQPLVRPMEAPKFEDSPGFHILRPDEIEATKLLPSDRVITDSNVAATIMAMIMGALAVRYFGPALMRFSSPQPASGGLGFECKNRLDSNIL